MSFQKKKIYGRGGPTPTLPTTKAREISEKAIETIRQVLNGKFGDGTVSYNKDTKVLKVVYKDDEKIMDASNAISTNLKGANENVKTAASASEGSTTFIFKDLENSKVASGLAKSVNEIDQLFREKLKP